MSEWKEVKLGEFVKVQGGYAFKSKDFKSNGIPIVKIKNLINNKIDLTEADYVDEKFLEIANNYIINNGDVLISLTGSNVNQSNSMVGKVAYVTKNTPTCLLNQRVGRLILKKNNIDLKYIFYFLSQKKIQYYLASNASGSANQANINSSTIENLKIPYKDYMTTKKIADILSVIDEKIETLQNINETLEELAKAIFKSWFVDFDIVKAKTYGKSDSEIAKEFGISEEIVKLFPSEFETSEIGEIPKGWELSYLGEKNFSEIISSGIKKFQGEKIYLATADVNNTEIINKETKITYNNRPSRANMQPIHKSVWFAKMKDSKKILMFDDYSDVNSYILSTGFAGIKTTDLSHYFLWSFIMTDDFEKQKNNLANGAVQIAINNQNIKKIHFVKPSKLLLQTFNTKTLPIFKTIYFNTQQIQTLQNLRDTLLPKLINGEIEVDELDVKGLE